MQAHGQAGLVLALISNLLCPSAITGRPKLLGILKSFAEQTNQTDLAAVINRLDPLLFYDFMLSEGQEMLAKNFYVVASKKLPSPVAGVAVKYIDPGQAIDKQDKWQKSYDEIVLKKAR